MIIKSKINGTERNILNVSPLKEVFISNPNLKLIEAFEILGIEENKTIVQEAQTINEPAIKMPTMELNNSVPMEETPAQTSMGSFPIPNIGEINALRSVIADTADRLSRLTDDLDELHQMLQQTLDGGKDLTNNNETSMKM